MDWVVERANGYTVKTRGKAVSITRQLRCDDCGLTFTQRCENREDEVADCPECEISARQVPGSVAIGTNKGRAIDFAQQVAEEDYGLTNIRDNQRVGDISAMAPTAPTAREDQAFIQQMKEYQEQTTGQPVAVQPQAPRQGVDWGGSAAEQIGVQTGGANLTTPIRGTGQGPDPMGALHSSVRAGSRNDLLAPQNLRIVARDPATA